MVCQPSVPSERLSRIVQSQRTCRVHAFFIAGNARDVHLPCLGPISDHCQLARNFSRAGKSHRQPAQRRRPNAVVPESPAALLRG